MRTLNLFCYFSIFFRLIVFSQNTNNLLVEDMHQRASTFYEQDKFVECLTLLERAETLDGEPDPKILYLKVKAFYALSKQDKKYAELLNKSIETFKIVIFKQDFDTVKIQEISNLEQQLAQIQADAIVQKEKEKADFMSAIAWKDTWQLDSFLSKYPNSAYTNEILVLKKSFQQKRYEEKLRQLEADLAKANHKISSGRFMTVMGVLTATGWGLWVALLHGYFILL